MKSTESLSTFTANFLPHFHCVVLQDAVLYFTTPTLYSRRTIPFVGLRYSYKNLANLMKLSNTVL